MNGQWNIGDIITDKSYPYQQLRAAVEAECLRAITCGKWIIATADGPTSAERDKNAALIAAAPDLLEALKHLIDWREGLKPCDPGTSLDATIAMARAAIAKAEGVTP